MSAQATQGATMALRSENGKTGLCAVTYASIDSTCGPCALKGHGCYAQGGRVALIVQRLDAEEATALQAARSEAALIRENARKAPNGYPLRLHASGDCKTETCARILAEACTVWKGPVWTYSHMWRDIPRAAWGQISVLASIEDPRDGRWALACGYAPALVVHSHPKDGRAFQLNGVEWIPCPEQTRGRTCIQCRLCFDAEGLKQRRQGITFETHGQSRRRANAAIAKLQPTTRDARSYGSQRAQREKRSDEKRHLTVLP